MINLENLKLESLRNFRNQLLKDSDWIVLPDSPVSPDKRQEWIVYRQYLRDLPENFDFSGQIWTDEIMGSRILPSP
jgi:hypothetical protein